MTVRDEQVALLALCAMEGITGTKWSLIAREALSGGITPLLQGTVSEQTKQASEVRDALAQQPPELDRLMETAARHIERAVEHGARLVTVLDDEYPLNLREITDLPPFLFVRGTTVRQDDARAVAVVGTRRATDEGLTMAAEVATALVERGVTVVSGMARGIDTAAHTASLDAGGRTIAVVGTGILRTYPPENSELEARIVEQGAVVSQFWPDAPPGRHTFPMRNVVSSGISQGTVVIEASETSGARMQARLAHEHGKQVFLVERLTGQPWAQKFIAERKAIKVSGVEDIMSRLRSPEELQMRQEVRRQLVLELN